MTNQSIVCAVSEQLRSMLWARIEPHDHFGLRNERDIVFTSPAARVGGHSSQLSLWLYHMTPVTAARETPSKRLPNPAADTPAQALALHYLVTPLATDADKNLHLIEIVLRTFFSQPVVVANATPAGRQELRISQRSDTVIDRAAIWRALRTEYQFSLAYDVTGLTLGGR